MRKPDFFHFFMIQIQENKKLIKKVEGVYSEKLVWQLWLWNNGMN